MDAETLEGRVRKYQTAAILNSVLFCSIHGNLLLFEISPVFFVNQDQIEVIFHAELIVDVPVGWSQIVRAQE
jgi:hypothetical protein